MQPAGDPNWLGRWLASLGKVLDGGHDGAIRVAMRHALAGASPTGKASSRS